MTDSRSTTPIQLCQMTASDMASTLGGGIVLQEAEDAGLQPVRHVLAAALGDEGLELGLEVGALEARRTPLEVLLELRGLVGRELAVEEVVEVVQQLVAVLAH